MAYRTLDQLTEGSVSKAALTILKDSGIKKFAQFQMVLDGWHTMLLLAKIIIKSKTKIRMEYVNSHKEYDPFFDTYKEYRFGYALMIYINDVATVCVKQNQSIPFQSLSARSTYQNLEVFTARKIYKSKSPGKELHKLLNGISDQVKFFTDLFHFMKDCHNFDEKLKKGKTLYVRTHDSNFIYGKADKIVDKKRRLKEVRKQHLLLMGSKTHEILNPEWFTNEGIEPTDIPQHTVYLLTEQSCLS